MTNYNNDSIGAFWQKKDKNDQTYYTGKVEINGEEHYVTLFKNKYFSEENKPFFIAKKSLKKED